MMHHCTAHAQAGAGTHWNSPQDCMLTWHKLQPCSKCSVTNSLTFAWPTATIDVEQDLQNQTHLLTAGGKMEEALVPPPSRSGAFKTVRQ